MSLLNFSLTRPFNISFRRPYFDLVIGNSYFRIERSGLPFSHRDLWRDEAGGLNGYFMGLYFWLVDKRPTKRTTAVQA